LHDLYYVFGDQLTVMVRGVECSRSGTRVGRKDLSMFGIMRGSSGRYRNAPEEPSVDPKLEQELKVARKRLRSDEAGLVLSVGLLVFCSALVIASWWRFLEISTLDIPMFIARAVSACMAPLSILMLINDIGRYRQTKKLVSVLKERLEKAREAHHLKQMDG
jgi:hypothetical protein